MTIETTDSFVKVSGGSIFVRQWRSEGAQRSPLVLLHDSLGSVELWRDFPALLAEVLNRHVIAYDRLGFGKSTLRTDRPSITFIDDEAENFPAVRNGLGLERFALFGHSVGGAMAVRIAAALQDSVRPSSRSPLSVSSSHARWKESGPHRHCSKIPVSCRSSRSGTVIEHSGCSMRGSKSGCLRSSRSGVSIHISVALSVRCWRSTVTRTNTARRNFRGASPAA